MRHIDIYFSLIVTVHTDIYSTGSIPAVPGKESAFHSSSISAPIRYFQVSGPAQQYFFTICHSKAHL